MTDCFCWQGAGTWALDGLLPGIVAPQDPFHYWTLLDLMMRASQSVVYWVYRALLKSRDKYEITFSFRPNSIFRAIKGVSIPEPGRYMEIYSTGIGEIKLQNDK